MAVDDFAFFDNADGKAGQVVIFTVVHAWHFSGFAANQRTTGKFAAFANTADDIGRDIDIQFAGGVVIQEEQRFSALHDNIVDAHRDQIDADGVMTLQVHGQTQLGADAIGAGNQYRLFVTGWQRDQRAKAAKTGHHFRTAGTVGHMLDALNEGVACFDIHTSVFVGQRGLAVVGHDGSRGSKKGATV